MELNDKKYKPNGPSPIDPPEIIKKCLSCKRPRCRNCVGQMKAGEMREYIHEED